MTPPMLENEKKLMGARVSSYETILQREAKQAPSIQKNKR